MAGPASPREQLPTSRPAPPPDRARQTPGRALARPRAAPPRLRRSRGLAGPPGPISVSGGAQTHAPPETATALLEGEITVGVSRPISRVLSGGLLRDGHSSGAPLARRLEQPTRAAAGIEPGTLGASPERPAPPLFGLAPGGVCRAASVAGGAVRSYRTVSPLPLRVAPRGRSHLCGTFPGVTPGGR